MPRVRLPTPTPGPAVQRDFATTLPTRSTVTTPRFSRKLSPGSTSTSSRREAKQRTDAVFTQTLQIARQAYRLQNTFDPLRSWRMISIRTRLCKVRLNTVGTTVHLLQSRPNTP